MAAAPERLASYQGRELYGLYLNSPKDLPDSLQMRSKYFACLLACDAASETNESIGNLASRLLDQGLSCILAWGPGCERVHDIFDEQEVCGRQGLIPDNATVMSTWHNDESLEEVLSFALATAIPDDFFMEETGSLLCLVIGRKEWYKELKCYLGKHPLQL